MRRSLGFSIESWRRSIDALVHRCDTRSQAAEFRAGPPKAPSLSRSYRHAKLTCVSCTAYYIAFGPHGPRRPPPPDEGRKVFFLSAAVIAAAVGVFSLTRLFANPVRPRTMTKEWQEATEEYMKVRSFHSIRALLLFEPSLTSNPTATRNGAHHIQAWHDGSEQVGETSSRPGEAQRRVKVRQHPCIIQTIPIPIPIPHFLGSTFHLVLFVCYISNQESCKLGWDVSPLGWHCVISPPVYRILEAFQFCLPLHASCVPVSLCALETQCTDYRAILSNLLALLSVPA